MIQGSGGGHDILLQRMLLCVEAVLHAMCLPNLYLSKFLQGSVNDTCDAYLDELRDSLGVVCGAEVSLSTIWRSLKRSGYKMKKVRLILDVFLVS
jgi:hypothetical protein